MLYFLGSFQNCLAYTLTVWNVVESKIVQNVPSLAKLMSLPGHVCARADVVCSWTLFTPWEHPAEKIIRTVNAVNLHLCCLAEIHPTSESGWGICWGVDRGDLLSLEKEQSISRMLLPATVQFKARPWYRVVLKKISHGSVSVGSLDIYRRVGHGYCMLETVLYSLLTSSEIFFFFFFKLIWSFLNFRN